MSIISSSGAIFKLLKSGIDSTATLVNNNNWFKVRRYTFDSAARVYEYIFFYLFVHSTTTKQQTTMILLFNLTNVRHLTTAEEEKCSISLKFMYSSIENIFIFPSLALPSLPSIFIFEMVFFFVFNFSFRSTSWKIKKKLNSFVRCLLVKWRRETKRSQITSRWVEHFKHIFQFPYADYMSIHSIDVVDARAPHWNTFHTDPKKNVMQLNRK